MLARILFRLFCIGAAASLATACTSNPPAQNVSINPASFGQPDAPQAAQVSQEYRIGPFDELKVTIFQVPDLSGNVSVDSTGRVSLPLVGEVPVAGQTPRELQGRLQTLYSAKYLQDPQITVSVEKAVNQRITLDGAVGQPGVYPITGSTTLMQAIALARGARDDAVLSRVVVFRTIDGQRQAAAFDLRQIRQGKLQDPAVYGDDIVIVDGSSVRRNVRDVLGAIPILAIFNPF